MLCSNKAAAEGVADAAEKEKGQPHRHTVAVHERIPLHIPLTKRKSRKCHPGLKLAEQKDFDKQTTNIGGGGGF